MRFCLSGLTIAALAALAGCSSPRVEDQVCRGLVSGDLRATSGGMTVSSQGEPASAQTPGATFRQTVAARTARMMSARMSPGREAPQPDAAFAPAPASVARSAAAGSPVIDINLLAMTTGGQYGSFSSGFLSGWGARQTDARPDFAVVTGASAGGIVAPLVFAGRAFDDRLGLNTGITDADVVRKRTAVELLGASSLYSTAPLRRSLEAAVDDALVSAIAARWSAGNDLFIGATNLNRGRFDLFDIGMFMADGSLPVSVRKDCLISAVMATSAIPVLFPPQRINGDLYTDAGVRQSVFLQGVRDGIAESQRLLEIEVRVSAYVIVNSDLTVPEADTDTGLPGVTERTFALISDEGLRQSLAETADLARASGWRLRAIRAPEFSTLGCPGDTALFSPCVTRALFAAGRDIASRPDIPWIDGAELKRIARQF